MKFWNWVELTGYILSLSGMAILFLGVTPQSNAWYIALCGGVIATFGWAFGRNGKNTM